MEYYEYAKSAASSGLNRSLHSKVTVFDDACMLVGSANADVRSYMMDANNGFFFCSEGLQGASSDAPAGISAYREFLARQISERAKQTDVFVYAERKRADLLAEDRQLIQSLGEKYRAERWLDAEQTERLTAEITQLLEQAYRLSTELIAEGADSAAAREFDLTFKTL